MVLIFCLAAIMSSSHNIVINDCAMLIGETVNWRNRYVKNTYEILILVMYVNL